MEAQVTLTLRLVAGLTVPEIARALLMEPATVAQRLVRAKRKIRDAGIPMDEPPASGCPSASTCSPWLYLVYTEGHATAGPRCAVTTSPRRRSAWRRLLVA